MPPLCTACTTSALHIGIYDVVIPIEAQDEMKEILSMHALSSFVVEGARKELCSCVYFAKHCWQWT